MSFENQKIPPVEEPEEKTCTIEIEKVNSETLERIREAGVIFRVRTQDGKENYLATDSNGKIALTYLMPEEAGTSRVEIEEVKAPTGYKLYSGIQYLDLTFEEVDGEMVITDSQVTGNKITTTHGTKKVTASILNDVEETVVEPDKSTFNLIINKVDAETLENIPQAGVMFKVTKETDQAYVETLQTGIANLELNVPETAGTYTYKLSEIVGPNGYNKNQNELLVNITFTEVEGKLEISNLTVNEEKGIKGVGFQSTSAEVKVLNEKTPPPVVEPEEKTCTIEIEKVNSETLQKITKAGAIFRVRTQDGKESYLATDANGKITLTYLMPKEAGTSRVEIQEVKAPEGYKLYSEVQYLDLTFEEVDGEMVITSAQVTGDKIRVTHGENKATVAILNDKEETVVEPEEKTFNLIINKVDSETLENIPQAGVMFKVTNGNAHSYVETLQTGIANLELDAPETAGTYTYKLSEILGPNGYNKNENELLVNITFTEVGGKLEISNLTVNEEKGIKAVKFDKTSAEVKVLNEKTPPPVEEPEEKTCTIELQKVDSETLEAIAKEGVIFKIKTQDGQESYLSTDADGKITLTYLMPEEAGTSRIEIQELKAPNGYKLYEEVQYLDLTFEQVDGEMVITTAQVTGDKIRVTHGEDKATVAILNDKEEQVVEPDKIKFNLIINKVDSKTLENILQAGVMFKVEKGSKVAYVETLQTGIASLELEVPEEAGTYTYKLSEIVGPEGYNKNQDELYVGITFVEVDGKLEISKVVVNEESGIRVAEFDKTSAEIKVLNDKTEQKEPDEPKDPTTPTDPKEPEEPTKPTKPVKPTKPNNPDKGLSGLLPKTGEQMTIVILIGVAMLASVYYFIRMKKEKNS